jgi:hypothetical protein
MATPALAPYARDASLLWDDAPPHQPNHTHSSAQKTDDGHQAQGTFRVAQQPMRYTSSVTLRVPLGPYAAGDTLHAAHMHWWDGTLALFGTARDQINGTPTFKTHDGFPSAEEEHADVYVRETFAFLLRGHSLRTPGCVCRPPNPHRARVLGLPALTELQRRLWCLTRCPVDSRGTWPSLTELAQELAVRNLHGSVEVLRRRSIDADERVLRLPLLRVLIELAGLEPVYDAHNAQLMVGLGSRRCCVPRVIRSAEDVALGAHVLAPRPFLYDPRTLDPLTQNVVTHGLAELQTKLRVRVLESDTPGVLAVFCNARWRHLEPHADPGVVRAWHAIPAIAPPPPHPQQAVPAASHRKRASKPQGGPPPPRRKLINHARRSCGTLPCGSWCVGRNTGKGPRACRRATEYAPAPYAWSTWRRGASLFAADPAAERFG